MRSHYRIGNRRLPLILAVGLIVAGILFIEGGSPFDRTPAPATQAPVASVVAVSARPSSATAAPSARDPRTPIAQGYRVQIPRLGIDLPVAEGDISRDIDQQKTPVDFAFHLPGTAIPGQGSNTYLYAHARAGMFLTLWNARPGDEVFISTPDLRVIKYVVQETHPRVDYTDVSWVQPTPAERLTLQTSTGPNPTDPRFVVVAVPAT